MQIRSGVYKDMYKQSVKLCICCGFILDKIASTEAKSGCALRE